jgi:hypothetical protein
MGTSTTKQVNVRLGARARAQIADLCERMGTSAAGVLTMALDRYYLDTVGTSTPATPQASPQGHASTSTPTGTLQQHTMAHTPVHEHERATTPPARPQAGTTQRARVLSTYDPDLD